jgi:hypothetical protein
MKKEYYVTYKIEARYVAAVEAESLEEARKKAEEMYENTDFGEMECIAGDQIMIEDEDGNYVWER